MVVTQPVFAKPQNIVSINLCADQLLMTMVDHTRIRSVSYLAADPKVSALAREARKFPKNRGMSEEILIMNPDLVLAGDMTSKPTVHLLKSLGVRLVEIPTATSIADIRQNLRLVAKAVAEPHRGERIIQDFDRRLASAAAMVAEDRPLATAYWENGLTSGDETLFGAALEAVGMTNLAARLGISGVGYLPLELLITSQPQILIMRGSPDQRSSYAVRTSRHPALGNFASGRLVVRVPDPLWICGTPFLVEAIEQLSRSYREWQSTE